MVENMNIYVENGIIQVAMQHCMWPNDIRKVKVYLTVPVLDEIQVNSSSNVWAQQPITVGNHLTLSINELGNSTMLLAANVQHADLTLAGTGHIKLTTHNAQSIQATISSNRDLAVIDLFGSSENLSVALSGSAGLCRAYEMPIEQALINISGRGECQVEVFDTLNVDIAGVGTVYYKGAPSIHQVITGTGTIEQAL